MTVVANARAKYVIIRRIDIRVRVRVRVRQGWRYPRMGEGSWGDRACFLEYPAYRPRILYFYMKTYNC